MTPDDIRYAADEVAAAGASLDGAKATLRQRVILAIDEGMSPAVVAAAARVTRQTVWNWTNP